MSKHAPVSIDIDRELYDRVMALPRTGEVEDFVEDATRFWLALAESGPDPLPKLTREQEAVARRLLKALLSASPEGSRAMFATLELIESKSR